MENSIDYKLDEVLMPIFNINIGDEDYENKIAKYKEKVIRIIDKVNKKKSLNFSIYNQNKEDKLVKKISKKELERIAQIANYMELNEIDFRSVGRNKLLKFLEFLEKKANEDYVHYYNDEIIKIAGKTRGSYKDPYFDIPYKMSCYIPSGFLASYEKKIKEFNDIFKDFFFMTYSYFQNDMMTLPNSPSKDNLARKFLKLVLFKEEALLEAADRIKLETLSNEFSFYPFYFS